VFLRSGSFSPAEIIGVWKAAISEVMYDGCFDVVRAVQTWSQHEVTLPMEELLTLESELNHYLPLYPQVIVCLYDLERFGSGLVVDLLKTHPRVLLGTNVLENPYWLSPDEVAAAQDGQRDMLREEREEAAAWCYAATTGST
jgi:DcmR-like sensory protein